MTKVRIKSSNKKRATVKPQTWEGPEETPWVMKLAKEAEREIKQRKGIIVNDINEFYANMWSLVK